MKRVFDCAASVIGLGLLWPVLLLAVLAIKLETAGPAIFAQPRIGHGGRHFTCYKLRTMHRDTEQLPTHRLGAGALTRCGRLLRRTKLDELPQLWNVLRGEMSLVGPRPCLPSQIELIDARRGRSVFGVRPGITGLAQVRGIDMSDPVRLAEIDASYVRNHTFLGDLGLILRTLTGAGLGRDPAVGPKRPTKPGEQL